MVTFIIVVYKSDPKKIKYILKNIEDKYPIIIIDNSKNYSFKNFKISKNTKILRSNNIGNGAGINLAIENIMKLVRSINKYLELKEPWKTLKENSQNQQGLNTLSISCEAIALSAKLLFPVMPKKCEKIFDILSINKDSMYNLDFETISGNNIEKHEALFPRIENDD